MFGKVLVGLAIGLLLSGEVAIGAEKRSAAGKQDARGLSLSEGIEQPSVKELGFQPLPVYGRHPFYSRHTYQDGIFGERRAYVEGRYFNLSDDLREDEQRNLAPVLYVALKFNRKGMYYVVDTGVKMQASRIEKSYGRCQFLSHSFYTSSEIDEFEVLISELTQVEGQTDLELYIVAGKNREPGFRHHFINNFCVVEDGAIEPRVRTLFPNAQPFVRLPLQAY